MSGFHGMHNQLFEKQKYIRFFVSGHFIFVFPHFSFVLKKKNNQIKPIFASKNQKSDSHHHQHYHHHQQQHQYQSNRKKHVDFWVNVHFIHFF